MKQFLPFEKPFIIDEVTSIIRVVPLGRYNLTGKQPMKFHIFIDTQPFGTINFDGYDWYMHDAQPNVLMLGNKPKWVRQSNQPKRLIKEIGCVISEYYWDKS